MLLKSHRWRHLVKCTKNFVFQLTCTARHASRWFINTGLKRGSFQLVSASHFAVHSSCVDIMDTCGFGRSDVATDIRNTGVSASEGWARLHTALHSPGVCLWLPLSPPPSIWRIQHPSPDIRPWQNKYHFFFILDIIMDQIHTHLRDQDYLQSPSSKPCPFAHSPKRMYLFSSRHTGALHTMNIHLVTREPGKQTEAGATWARAWTCCEGEVL